MLGDEILDLSPFDGSWLNLLQSTLSTRSRAVLKAGLESDGDSLLAGGNVEQLDQDDPQVSLYTELLAEPRATLAALATMPADHRSLLAEFLIIEAWAVRPVIDFATRGNMHFLSILEEELGHADEASDALNSRPGPAHGELTYTDLVSLGPKLGWTNDDLIELLLSTYPRCAAIAGLTEFILERVDQLKNRIVTAPGYPELHPFFGHCWELPAELIALFGAELEAAAAAKGRRVDQEGRREQAVRLLELAGIR